MQGSSQVDPRVTALAATLQEIEAHAGVTPASLQRMAGVLAAAARDRLATPPGSGDMPEGRTLLWRGEEGDRTLSLVALTPGRAAPPRPEPRWSIVAGLRGAEVILLFDRLAGSAGPVLRLRDCLTLEPGRAAVLLPGDIASRHARGRDGGPVLQLRYEATLRRRRAFPEWLSAGLLLPATR